MSIVMGKQGGRDTLTEKRKMRVIGRGLVLETIMGNMEKFRVKWSIGPVDGIVQPLFLLQFSEASWISSKNFYPKT